MPNLADLTDNAIPQQDAALPVEQPYRGVNLGPLQGANSGVIGNTPVAVAPAVQPAVVQALPVIQADPQAFSPDTTSVGSTVDKIINRLTGSNGEERYQTWPEKVIREALAAPADAISGATPQYSVDPTTGDVHTSPQMIAGAQAMSALAGSGGVAGVEEGADAALGATPFLRPALKYGDKIYKAPVNGQHLDALPAHLADTFQKQALSGEDISNFNFGFMNHKGQFLDREKALDYAVKEGLVDPSAGQYGALTSTLLADSSKPGTAIEAMAKTGSPFYSALEHNVNQISQSKMTGDQWLGTLANKPGVKPEEMDWTGVKDFLKERGNQPVTKAELHEHLANNKVELNEKVSHTPNPQLNKMLELDAQARHYEAEGETDAARAIRDQIKAIPSTGDFNPRYKGYQLPGGENYREMLMTLPNKQQRHYEYEWFDPATQKSKQFKTEAEAKADAPRGAIVNPKEVATTNEAYRSSHWDEPNILAHVRMNDRVIDGKKSLHLEEIQSDWHQQGRDKGYRTEQEKQMDSLVKERDTLMAEAKAADEARKPNAPYTQEDFKRIDDLNNLHDKINALGRSDPGVPDAPFKKTWHELALKRMIREAAEKGYDRLSWTPGEAQAARYDLSKKLDTVRADPQKDGTFNLSGMKNKSLEFEQKNVAADKVADFVGKDLAEKLLKSEKNMYGMHELKGIDLKVGGEGMKGFYDQIIPKALSKISGEKVKTAELPGKLSNRMGQPPETHPVHYIDIPQSLKDKAMQKGFPLFSGNYMYTPVSGNPFEKKKKK